MVAGEDRSWLVSDPDVFSTARAFESVVTAEIEERFIKRVHPDSPVFVA